MKNLVALIGIVLTLLGLLLMARGVGEMVNIGCDASFSSCVDTNDLTLSFAGGITLLVIGPIIWNAGAYSIRTGSHPNMLGWLGYLGIFGVSFLGVGLTMLYQAVQPGSENPGGVLWIIGISFSLVGLGSIAVEILSHVADRNTQRLRATGLHGRGVVVGIHDTGITVNLDPVVKFDLRVELPGVTPYVTSVRHTVPRLQVGSLTAGLAVSVLADPAHPNDITVDWDAPMTPPADPAMAGAGPIGDPAGTGRRHALARGGAYGVAGTVPGAGTSAAGTEAAALNAAAAALTAAAAAAEARAAAGASATGASAAGSAAGSTIDLGTTVNVQGGALSPELLRTVSQALTAAAASGDLTETPVVTIDARGLTQPGSGAAAAGLATGAAATSANPAGSSSTAGSSAGATAGAPGPGSTGDDLPARVQIDGLQDTGVDMGGARLFAFDLTVSVSGRQPYQTKYAGSVPTSLVPRLVKGASFPAIVDPARPGDLTIEWDR